MLTPRLGKSFQFQQGSIITFIEKADYFSAIDFQFQQGSIITLILFLHKNKVYVTFNSNKVQL